jgi:hypothetical protein
VDARTCKSSGPDDELGSNFTVLITWDSDAWRASKAVEIRSGDSRAGISFAPRSSMVLCARVAGSWRISIGIGSSLALTLALGFLETA